MEAGIESKIGQLKQIEQQLQGIMGQKYQLEMKLSESTRALEAMNDVSDDTPVYSSAGKLLFRVDDHKKLVDSLTEDKETVEIRLSSLEKQEKTLKTTYESLMGQIQSAMQTSGASG